MLLNLRDAGFQDAKGNIIIDKATYINDNRPCFGVIEQNFGKVKSTDSNPKSQMLNSIEGDEELIKLFRSQNKGK